MNPQETQELGEFIVQIKDKYDLTVFMIEHHMDLVMQFSDRIYVIDDGRIVGSGSHEELLKSCKPYYEIASSQLSEKELVSAGTELAGEN